MPRTERSTVFIFLKLRGHHSITKLIYLSHCMQCYITNCAGDNYQEYVAFDTQLYKN